jgi:hypothetical protein
VFAADESLLITEHCMGLQDKSHGMNIGDEIRGGIDKL